MRAPLRPLLIALGIAAAGLTAAFLPASSHAADTKPMRVGVVDMQRAVMETEDGLRAQSTLRKFFERRQLELNLRQEELAKKKEDIEKQAKVLSKEALQRALEDWQKQLNELQLMHSDFERERVAKQNQITGPIYGRVSGLLRKLAQRESYDLILDRQAVPYAKADLDLTDQLILMYNNNEEPAHEQPAPPSSAAPAGSAPAAPPAPAPASASAPRPAASAPPAAPPPAKPAKPAKLVAIRLPSPSRLSDLVASLGGSLDEGLEGVEISSIASPEGEHDEGSLVAVFRPRYARAAAGARGPLLLSPELAPRFAPGRRWVHPQPEQALARLLPRRPAQADQRHLAHVDPGARVSSSASLGPGVVVCAGAEVGDEVTLEPRAVIFGGVRLGRGARVGAGSVLGREGFGWVPGPEGTSRMPHPAGVIVEEGADIGALCTVDAGVLEPTVVGRGARLDSHVHVGHNVRIGAFTHVAAQSGFAGSVVVGERALIGGQVGVADHVVVGDGARLAAKAGVIGDVPPGTAVAGYPAVERTRWLRALARLFNQRKI